MKAALRKGATRTVDALHKLIGKLLKSFAPQMCANYFRHAGYTHHVENALEQRFIEPDAPEPRAGTFDTEIIIADEEKLVRRQHDHPLQVAIQFRCIVIYVGPSYGYSSDCTWRAVAPLRRVARIGGGATGHACN